MQSRDVTTDMARLARLIAAYAPHDGGFDLRVPGLHVSRYSRANAELVHNLQLPSLCIVAQGAKVFTVGQQPHEYDPSRMLVVSVALPGAARVVRATASEPYLALRLDLSPSRMADIVLKVYPRGLPPVSEKSGVYVAPVDPRLVGAAARLLECLAEPDDVELLAPLVVDEICIRLLRCAIGPRVAQMGLEESSVQRVGEAIAWLRDNFAQPVRVEHLAGLVHMSASSFHEHFRAVTSMSPLQYQKALRLQEARRLMLSTTMDASTAGQQVGYVSASQFSRDYSRFFGNPPSRDIAGLRHQMPVVV